MFFLFLFLFLELQETVDSDIGYGSYFNSFTGEQKHKKVVPESMGGA
jgi:hypothetical protein